ncbi:hypothetical protein P3T76_005687 [Phytophthora citrophthora]|uniref:FYVE-type domain-containing protein n=1 Tax=Phytophthora citrophthora TaxID=4793 RepID=A0AAD9GR56_9STRA|nr:hypothetical protein P3T76_005687 [Phytophthora citrophthora]
MKFTLPNGVFPPVKLSRKHQGALIEEAETVVSETIAANETFLAQGAQFRDPKWRLIRVKEGLHVYRQRPSGAAKDESPLSPGSTWPSGRPSRRFRVRAESRKGLEQETPLSPSSVVAENSIQETMRRPGVSLVVVHGTVDGTLDDSMFGAFAATDLAWKWRSTHINDRLDDARILSTIQGPTRQDPFRFLGIKWFAKEHPAVLTSILQRRDFLIMEATGLTKDSKGEKVGYFLMHSVALRTIPELSEMGILRGELSFCFILRQGGLGKVELYCRGFSDPRGDMMERVSVAIAAESLICSAGVVDYAYIKKLTWLMNHKSGQIFAQRRDSRSSHCESCNKSFTKFTILSGTSGKGSACQICRRMVCAKCSVVKKMTVDVSATGTVKQCALRFCLACLLEAKEKPAWEMALDGLESSSESSSTSGSGSSVGTPHSRFASLPHKLNHSRNDRSYSEYQRAGTRVYRQGEIATDFRRSIKPEHRASDRFPARTTQWQSEPQSSSANSAASARTRSSERPRSTPDMRFHTLH